MLRRFPWLFVFVLLFVADARAQSEPPPQQPPAANTVQGQAGEAKQAPPPPTATEEVDSQESAERDDEPCHNANSDLCQQARMAVAAEGLVTLTKIEIAALFATFVFSIGTALYTIFSNQSQLRAYVGVVSVRTAGLHGAPADIAVGVKNTGQTPARHLKLRMRSIAGSDVSTFDFDLSKVEQIPLVDLLPGEGQTSRIRMRPDLLAAFKANPTQIKYIVSGEITYRDAFGWNRLTTFRYAVDPDKHAVDHDLLTCTEGNEIR